MKCIQAELQALIRAEIVLLLSDPPPELRSIVCDLVEAELDERGKAAMIRIGAVPPPGQTRQEDPL